MEPRDLALREVRENPWLQQRELAARLSLDTGLAESTLIRLFSRMEADGELQSGLDGRRKTYALAEPGAAPALPEPEPAEPEPAPPDPEPEPAPPDPEPEPAPPEPEPPEPAPPPEPELEPTPEPPPAPRLTPSPGALWSDRLAPLGEREAEPDEAEPAAADEAEPAGPPAPPPIPPDTKPAWPIAVVVVVVLVAAVIAAILLSPEKHDPLAGAGQQNAETVVLYGAADAARAAGPAVLVGDS